MSEEVLKSHILKAAYNVVHETNSNGVQQDDAFFVMDIQDLIDKHNNWVAQMPRIRPYYAVKSNNSQMILEVLAGLGAAFDCASKGEIAQVLPLGIDPSCDIIYANPCKCISHLNYAASVGVDLMTFDNDEELRKIAKHYPDARLVLRIFVDDSKSICPLGGKFGARKTMVPQLLRLAKQFHLNVMGVSFHVGGRSQDETAFSKAIEDSRQIIDIAESEEFAFKITLLDIGGGFPGASWHSSEDKPDMFELIAKKINLSLEKHFPVKENAHLRIISEPGTYYCASSLFLACQIIGKRQDQVENGKCNQVAADKLKKNHLYVNEGVFGSFLLKLFGNQFKTPIALLPENQLKTRIVFNSVIWGHTLDSNDQILSDIPLPDMHIGEWLLFQQIGDYSLTFACSFNGHDLSGMTYCAQQETRDKLSQLETWPLIKRRLDYAFENFAKYLEVRKLEK